LVVDEFVYGAEVRVGGVEECPGEVHHMIVEAKEAV
jgi:hypothetical protein